MGVWAVVVPGLFFWFVSGVDDGVVGDFDSAAFDHRIAPDEVYAFFYIEDVAVDFRVHVSYRGQDAGSVVLADVVAEDVVDALALTEHHAAAAIVAAVVVLVNGSVAGVGIPCLSVLVVDGVVGFVILEQGGFAFPWPDGGCGHAATVSFFVVQIRMDVYGDIFGYVVLDQRFKAVHRCDAVSADIFDKVVFDHDIGGAVGFHYFIGQFQGREFVMLVGVACGNSPSAAFFDFAVMDVDTVITGDSGLFFVVRA